MQASLSQKGPGAKMQTQTVEFSCRACGEETVHRVRYVGNRLAAITCRRCGRTIGITRTRLVNYYAGEVAERLVTKPFRLVREFQSDRQSFLRSLPTRVVTKPLRVVRELTEVLVEATRPRPSSPLH